MNKSKKFLLTLILTLFLVGPVLVVPRPTYAQNTDFANLAINSGKWIWERVEKVYYFLQERVGSQVINNTVRTFVNNLAYNIADSIAQGAEDGKAYFRRESIKDSLQKSKDAALGEFIGSLSQSSFADLGFNLCDPSVEVKLSLSLALLDSKAPPAPKCNWREVEKKWSQFSDKIKGGQWDDFIKLKLSGQGTVQDWEDVWSSLSLANSDLGVAQTLVEKLLEKELKAEDVAKMTAEECKGFRDVASPIAGQVKTHCMTVLAINEKQWDLIIEPEVQRLERLAKEDAIKLGDILKDAGGYFMKTLSSKMLKYALKWGQECIATKGASCSPADSNPTLRNSILDQLRGGADLRRPARGSDVLRDLFTVNFEEVESFSLLENFAICPDEADFRHPDNCVISSAFLQAVGEKKTIAQLISDGQLDPQTTFISTSDPANNSDTCYRDGFCYHNLVKLRKANVIPVGWEMAATLSPAGQAVTLGELVACFEDDGCPYSGTPHNPYYHLVDPDWVLKIPPARCEALVYASTLESKESNTRQEYCADVTTCLREDDEGNCLDGQYGYCSRSENIWRLDGDRCVDGEIYSGCLTFAKENKTSSYLEQSLDYCTADDVGCKRYSQEQDENNAWVLQTLDSDTDDLFLNDQASECPSEQAGCHEYIVMAAGRGVNLLPNGSFEYDLRGWDGPNMSIVTDAYFESKAGYFENSISTTFESGVALKERKFIFSFQGKAATPNNFQLVVTTSEGTLFTQDFDIAPSWQPESFTIEFTADVSATSFGLQILGPNAIIDSAKLEEAGASQTLASSFSNYGDGARIFMNDNRQMCLAEEVGCQGYYPLNGQPMIPGVISSGDLCPAECVGYSSFAQSPNIFDIIEGDDQTEYYNFIADTALSCPSDSVGCEEFTNLDIVAEGGEGKEYYSYLRQCVANTVSNIQTYYTWEGQDVTGYQLKTWTFLKSNLNSAPCTNVAPGLDTCVDSNDPLADHYIAACGTDTPDPADDPDVNPNCREFFDTDGNAHYRLEDRVIYASADCQPYKRSATGQEYQAITALSQSCQPQYAGCRLYAGEAANNVREIFLDNFEIGSYAPWSGSSLDLSNESLTNGGHSLKINGDVNIERAVGDLQNGKTYQLSWWMKSTGNLNNVRVLLDDGTTEYQIGTLENIGTNNWRNYQVATSTMFNFTDLDNITLRLEFTGSGDIFLDNLLLKEVFDNVSLVKNSWSTPASCDMPFTGAYLGCQAYADTNGANYNLKSFTSLCREDSIGCMAAIDTHNSTNPFAESFHTGLPSAIDVPYDNMVYIVPKVENYCPQAYKGCSALGLPQVDQANDVIELDEDGRAIYSTVYKVNNPDNYARSLCTADNLYCDAYNSAKGTYYFRDPGTKNCSYEKNLNVNGAVFTGWFKTETLIQGVTPIGCSDNNNGSIDSADLELNLTDNWAGSCPEEKNLCTTFTDPLDNDKAYYYYNNNKIDQSSCNGQFDQNSGCILLRDENNWNGDHSSIVNQYNVVDTYAENISQDKPVSPVTSGDLDTNVLVKVRKDRQCAEWLSCKSSTAVFDENTNSYKVICDAIDSCTEFNATSNITKCAQWSSYGNDAPLTVAEYQDRASGDGDHLTWSDKEYIGYSVPNTLPVKDLVSYNFAAEDAPADLRLVYQTEETCTIAQDLQACSPTLSGTTYTNQGVCKDQVCWLNPKANDEQVSISTRAYATQDAPFASQILNAFKETASQAFSQANICENGGNACEPGYKKVTYGNGGFVKYIGSKETAPAGVCTIIGETGLKEEGDDCTPADANSCGGAGGRCAAPSKIETFLNWQGICLEFDRSTTIPEDGATELVLKNYCNQWYPVEQIQGTQSLYNNFTTAGFYNEAGYDLQMCTVGSEYNTQEDRYYCVAEAEYSGGLNFCSIIAKVPVGSKINVDADGVNDFAFAGYLNLANISIGSESQNTTVGTPIIFKTGAHDGCDLGDPAENAYEGDERECISMSTIFQAGDFIGASSEIPIISDSYLQSLFSTEEIAGQIEYFYYDEEVLSTGVYNDGGLVLSPNYEREYVSNCTGTFHYSQCSAGKHQIYSHTWHGGSHCWSGGPRHHRGERYCNPLDFNYYIQATSHSNVCESNCSGSLSPAKGERCLDSKPIYAASPQYPAVAWNSLCTESNLAATSTAAAAKCFKTCVENLTHNEMNDHLCSLYGEVLYDSEVETALAVGTSQCFRALYGVNASGTLVPRVEANFLNEVLGTEANPGCLVSNVDLCAPAPLTGYLVDVDPSTCEGLNCLQQCQVISEVGAEGEEDKSWVRTDVWWRSEQNSTGFNKGWQAYFYDSTSSAYIFDPAYFMSAGSTAINKYFGATEGTHNNIIVTKVPLDSSASPNRAALFFGETLADARAQMEYLFARLYNLTWNAAAGSYDSPQEIEIDNEDDVNPDAGMDYEPRIFKVCGDGLCNGGNLGITINGQNGEDIIGRVSVDTDLKFYYHAHPDHMPVSNIVVDWDDGTPNSGNTPGKYKNNMPDDYCKSDANAPGKGKMGFGGTSGACHSGYKVFYHPYIYDSSHLCDGSGGSPSISGAACYKPTVSVIDNWNEASTAEYDDWIIVYQE